MNSFKVQSLWQKDQDTLAIEWTDGVVQEFRGSFLREKCPCAGCKNNAFSGDVKPVEIFSVGPYALGILFEDGHKTGIYTFDFLRHLT
jgi:DUF971 family protein